MAKVTVYDMTGTAKGELELSEAVFGVEMNIGLVHQAVVRQLASQRLGTHKVKTRASTRWRT